MKNCNYSEARSQDSVVRIKWKLSQVFQGLTGRQKAQQSTLSIYCFHHNFHKRDMYGLTSHTMRSDISIPDNIAEGFTASILDSGS
jgi:hypothetical protein